MARLWQSLSLRFIVARDYAMISWLRNLLSRPAAAEEPEEAPDEVEEDFAPVGVRVRPHLAVPLEPADTYVAGYNVHENVARVDDEHSTTVNDMKTVGVDPYNAGPNSKLKAEEPDSDE